MAATWRLIFFPIAFFFSKFPWNLVYIGFRGLRVYWHCPFFVWDWKRGYGGHLDFLKFNNSLLTRKKIIIGSLQFFMWSYPWVWRWPDYNLSFPPIIKMASTWRLIFFSPTFFSELPRNLVQLYMFLGSASLLVLCVFMWDWKRGCGGHFGFINFNKSFLFSINCLETWHI